MASQWTVFIRLSRFTSSILIHVQSIIIRIVFQPCSNLILDNLEKRLDLGECERSLSKQQWIWSYFTDPPYLGNCCGLFAKRQIISWPYRFTNVFMWIVPEHLQQYTVKHNKMFMICHALSQAKYLQLNFTWIFSKLKFPMKFTWWVFPFDFFHK